MKKEDLKQYIDQFGMIRAKASGYMKTLHGHIKEIDNRGNVWFQDLDFGGLVFKNEDIESFEPKTFEPLGKEYKGKEIYWNGGRAYYKKTNKECDIDK